MSSSNFYVPFFNAYWILYGICGIVFQCVMLYLITRKSPAALSNLKCFLYNTALVQVSLIVFAFSLQHRSLSNLTSLAVLAMGPCRYGGPTLCFVFYQIYMAINLVAGSAISITVLFRFLVLVQNNVTSTQNYIMIAASYIAPVILPFTAPWDFPSVHLATAKEHPTYNLSIYYPYPGFADVTSIQFLSATLILCIGVYGASIGCVFLTWKALRIIRNHQQMSEKTKRQAQTLIHGLIVQSLLPTIAYIPTCSGYVYSQMTGTEILILEHVLLVSSSLPGLIDPFISLYFIVPYRQAILDVIRPRRQLIFNRSQNSTSANNHS